MDIEKQEQKNVEFCEALFVAIAFLAGFCLGVILMQVL